MSATAGVGGCNRQQELQAFEDTKAGVKGLVDAGVTAVPAIFHHTPDSLPVLQQAAAGDDVAATIPVIDLSCARREELVHAIKAAAETVGFFQVVNHGVAGGLLAETLAAVRRFNEAPAEAKRPYYFRGNARKVRFSSNFDLFQAPAANWRDTLFCDVAPEPPRPEELPEAVRHVMVELGDAARKLAERLLELLSESLGLARGHLREMDGAEGVGVASNYYPPCPEPLLTLGATRHTDSSFDPHRASRCLLIAVTAAGAGWTCLPCPALSSSTSATFFSLLATANSGVWSTGFWRTRAWTRRGFRWRPSAKATR